MKQKLKRFLAFICLIAVCLQTTSCSNTTQSTHYTEKKNVDAKQEQADFDQFLNELFLKEVQSDSITLNYTLKNPEKYGISNYTPTLGDYGVDYSKKNIAQVENIYIRLTSFSYSALTKDQKITYDILEDYYKVENDEEDYLLYGEALGNTTGIQAQLPILLSEYNFSNKKDIENYLKLLYTVDDYFEKIETFEQEKSKAGLFMSDHTADNIISQCNDFISDPDQNLLITLFNDRLDSFKWITDEEKKTYKEQNENAVKKAVIPAYEKLIDTITKLKGTGKNSGGIGNFPKGKTYYEKMAQASTGSDKSIKQMKRALKQTMQSAATKIAKLSKDDENIWDSYYNMKFPMTDPNKIVEYLKETVTSDFPELKPVNYKVKYVDKSLEDHVSPAFYLTPQLDNYKNNNIYINGSNNDLSSIFPTLAHEGYPGHLLQTVYFQQQNPTPLRAMLNYGGYSEGWATYAEIYSYDIAKLSGNLGEYAKQYSIFNLCMYAEMDIGVNYDCWDKKELANYLKDFGVTNQSAVDEVFDIVVDDPGNYLQYVIGYIEFANLRTDAEKQLGNKFNAKKFHTFLLNMGPSPFSVINKYMQDWIKTQK